MNRWICCALFGCMGFAMCHMEAQNTTMEGERQHASGSTVDVLTLTNGTTLLGEVTEENGEYVRFNDLSGKLNKLIYKEQIKEIGTTTVSGKQLKALTGKRQKRTVRPVRPTPSCGGATSVGMRREVSPSVVEWWVTSTALVRGLGVGFTCRLGITNHFFGAIPLYAAGKIFLRSAYQFKGSHTVRGSKAGCAVCCGVWSRLLWPAQRRIGVQQPLQVVGRLVFGHTPFLGNGILP